MSTLLINFYHLFLFSYDYYNVSRTLCPVERDQKKEPTEEAQIFVDVSSASTKDIHFVLRAEFVEHFELT